jgi:hypothetical protein
MICIIFLFLCGGAGAGVACDGDAIFMSVYKKKINLYIFFFGIFFFKRHLKIWTSLDKKDNWNHDDWGDLYEYAAGDGSEISECGDSY